MERERSSQHPVRPSLPGSWQKCQEHISDFDLEPSHGYGRGVLSVNRDPGAAPGFGPVSQAHVEHRGRTGTKRGTEKWVQEQGQSWTPTARLSRGQKVYEKRAEGAPKTLEAWPCSSGPPPTCG